MGSRAPRSCGDEAEERPRIREGIEISELSAHGAYATAFLPDSDRYIRIQAPQCAFLRSLDGRRSVAELERDVAGGLPEDMVRPLLGRFAELGLLEGVSAGSSPDHRRPRNLGSIELAVGNPERLLSLLARPILALGGPIARCLSAGVILAGVVSLALRGGTDLLAAPERFSAGWIAGLYAAMLLTGALHELGHAAAVVYFGGRVRRVGVMLFYLSPAMFCDTSDAWRLPHPWQRAVVALAGIWVQAVLAGLAGLALWLPLDPVGASWVAVFASLNLGLCVLNLIPFVKLDGYWVLVGLTDVPNLRARALDSLRTAALALIGGAQWRRGAGPLRVSSVLYGLGCLACPLVLVLTALFGYHGVLLRLGRAGAAAWLALALAVAAVGVRGLLRVLRASSAWPAVVRLRAGALGGIGVLALAWALAAVHVPLRVEAGLGRTQSGQTAAFASASVPGWFSAVYLRPALSTLGLEPGQDR